MRIRSYEGKDLKAVVDLWNRVLWGNRICEESFIERILLDPHFDTESTWIAEEDGAVKAAAIGFRRHDDPKWGHRTFPETEKANGFLYPFLIDDSPQGLELGKLLLGKAEEYFKAKGITASHGFYRSMYFPYGIDKNVYPHLYNFFVANGYKEDGVIYSMRVDLNGFRITGKAQALIEKLQQEGIHFQHYTPADTLAIREFFTRENPSWTNHFFNKLQRKDNDDEMVFAKQGDEIIGYCQYNYYGERERVGPFSVAASMRGRKIGEAMVAVLLETMSRRGFHTAFFSSCSEQNKHFYGKNGFEVFRENIALKKAI